MANFIFMPRRADETAVSCLGEGPRIEWKCIVQRFRTRRANREAYGGKRIPVVPKRASSSFGSDAVSTKVFEFLALGVPVIVSRTKIDSFYFNDSTVKSFESENVDDLARCMLQLAHDPLLRSHFAKWAEYAQQNSWDLKQQDYLRLVDSLVQNTIPVQQARILRP